MKTTINYNPSEEDKQFLLEGLFSSNIKNGMPKKLDGWVFVYDEEGKKVGGCKFLLFSKLVWIDILWVDKAHQGNGYGKKLLEAVEKEAQQKGCIISSLDTFEFQKAIPFYKKCGYQIISTVEALNGNDERYFMKKNL